MKSTNTALTIAIIAFVSLSACAAANPPSPSAELQSTAAPLATAYPGPYQLPLSDEFDLPAEFEYTRAAPELHEVISEKDIANDGGPIRMPYYLYLPNDYYEQNVRQPLPVILRLHGASGISSDDVGTFDPPQMSLPLHTRQEDFPFIVIFPIIPSNRSWQTITTTLNQLLDEVISRYPADQDRVYLTGFSAGGAGAYALATEVPERFAAVAVIGGYWPFPLAGGRPVERMCAFVETNIWAFHSEIDESVAVNASDSMMLFLIQGCDMDPHYTRYKDATHLETAARSPPSVRHRSPPAG